MNIPSPLQIAGADTVINVILATSQYTDMELCACAYTVLYRNTKIGTSNVISGRVFNLRLLMANYIIYSCAETCVVAFDISVQYDRNNIQI